MKTRYKHRQLNRGTSLVEMLIAGLLLSIGMMGLVSTWIFSFRVTANTDDIAIGYNLGRKALETVKKYGFPNANEGLSINYYNGNQESTSVSSARFAVLTNVVSSAVTSGTAGLSGAVAAGSAKRTVKVNVYLLSTGAIVYSTTTYMVRAGV